VAALEAEGLVARQLDGQDRRITRVTLTTRGRQRLEASKRRKTAYLAARLEALDESQVRQLDDSLGLIELLLEERG
jgi:DNA-binding MarR family transcriptional regulator